LIILVAILDNVANSSFLNTLFILSLICKLHCLLMKVQGDIYIFDGCLASITSIIVSYCVCSCNPYTAGISREQSGDCCGSLAEANEIKSDY
jgi:hypothetical protein